MPMLKEITVQIPYLALLLPQVVAVAEYITLLQTVTAAVLVEAAHTRQTAELEIRLP